MRTFPVDAFNGGPAAGTWTLHVADVAGGDAGTRNAWSIEIATGQGALDSGRPLRDSGGGGGVVPTISAFFGILIRMFWREHAPPHFHALYAEHEALIDDRRTLDIIQGHFPPRALALVREWAVLHRAELLENWELCQRKQLPKRIAPLE